MDKNHNDNATINHSNKNDKNHVNNFRSTSLLKVFPLQKNIHVCYYLVCEENLCQ